MPAKPKLGLVAICDAVYKDEQSNKPILAGVFSGDILVSAFPAELRVALYIEIQIPEPGPHEVDIQFHVGGKLLGGGKSQPTSAVKNETTMLLLQGVTLCLQTSITTRRPCSRARPLTKKRSVRIAPVLNRFK